MTKVKGEFRFNTTGTGRDFVIAQHNAVHPLTTARETIAAMKTAGHKIVIGDSARELRSDSK